MTDGAHCDRCAEGPFRGARGLQVHQRYCYGRPMPSCERSNPSSYIDGHRCPGCRGAWRRYVDDRRKKKS